MESTIINLDNHIQRKKREREKNHELYSSKPRNLSDRQAWQLTGYQLNRIKNHLEAGGSRIESIGLLREVISYCEFCASL